MLPDFTHDDVVDMLKAAAANPTPCPNSYEDGCRCGDHHPGLVAVTRESNRQPLTDALGRIPATVSRPALRLVASAEFPQRHCDGTLVCACVQCEHDRTQRIKHRRPEAAQPWQARPPRHLRKAA